MSKEYDVAMNLIAEIDQRYKQAFKKAGEQVERLDRQLQQLNSFHLNANMVDPLRQGIRRLDGELKEIKTASGPKDFFQKMIHELRTVLPDLREVKRLMTDISRIQQPTQRFGNDAERYVRQLREMEQRMRAIRQQGGPSGGEGGNGGSGSSEDQGGGMALIAGGKKLMGVLGAAYTIKEIYDQVDGYQRSMNQVRASTGITVKQMEQMSIISKSLYRQNLGESWEDLAQVISIAKQVTGQTGKELEKTAKGALVLRDAFPGLEVAQSIRTVDTMMKNFGITSEQAYNLLAQGAQKGLDKSDELLDTANEYSPYFAKLGFSAEGMFDTFSAGLEAGAFNLDKVGDGIKEFGIRTKDGSKNSLAAYKSLKMNGAQMTKEFAAGGVTAQKAFLKTAKAIAAIKDPVLANAVSVQLFGTQAEDLEARVIKSYSNIKKQFDQNKKTIDAIANIKYSSIGEAITGIGRQLNVALIIPMAEAMLPALSKFSNWFTKEGPAIDSFFKRVGKSVQPFLGVLQKTGTLFKNAFNETGDMSAATGISQFLINMGVAEDRAYQFSGALSDTFDKFAKLKYYFEIFKGAGNLFANAMAGTGDISAVTGINKALQSVGFSDDQSIQITNRMISMFDNIKKHADEFLQTLAPGFEESVKFIKSLFDTNFVDFGSIAPELNNLQKSIAPIAKQISSGIGPAFKSVGVIANSVIGFLKNGFNAVYPGILKFVSLITQTVGPAFNSVFGYITKTLLPQVSGVIAEWMPKITPVISGLVGLLTATLIPVVKGVVSAFQFAWPILSAVVTGAINMIKPAISMLLDILSGIITFLTGVFTGNWKQAFEGLKQIVVGVFDGIVGIIKSMVNSVIGVLNGVIDSVNGLKFDLPEWAGGGSIGGLNIPKLQTYADGGFANQVSIFGEAGPEAAIPLNNKQRSMDLLAKTNRIMGYNPAQSGGDSLMLQFDITIQGNANKEDVQQAINEAQPSFRQEYAAMKRQDARLSYG